MNKLVMVRILAATFVLAATAARAQYLGTASNPNSHPVRAYNTTVGPAGGQSHQHADR